MWTRDLLRLAAASLALIAAAFEQAQA